LAPTSPPTPPTPPSPSPRLPAGTRPSPIYTPPVDEGRLVPSGWLQNAPVTIGLIGLNVCAYLVEVVTSQGSFQPSMRAVMLLGASYPLATLHEGRVETLVTACFLHGGLVHLLFNMLALWQAGPLVERAVGSARMAPMYLVAGVFGYALSVAYGILGHALLPSLGASGAIAGLIGAAGVVFWRVDGWRARTTQAMARWLGLVVAFGVFVNSMGGQIDNAAHIGGALSGAAIAALWKRDAVYSPAATRITIVGCLAIVAISAGLVAVRDRQDPFAAMLLPDRNAAAVQALLEGRCDDAKAALEAVERLKTKVVGVSRLREQIEAQCGPSPGP
jgi:rhomboid protease GluP